MSYISNCKKIIIRESYLICEKPNITIKKYLGEYEGLYRVEVEFENIDDCNNFKVPKWFGKEINGTKLALDAMLVELNREEFLKILKILN